KNLNLLVRQAVEGFITGLHKSPHKGFSVEFSEHREYTPGDDLRRLDWGAWGRSDRYYVKQYEQETNLRAYVLLDASASMDYRHTGPITKFQYGCYLSACLSYLMARQQDVVGMIAFDEAVRFHLPPGSTPAHLDRLFKQLEILQPGRGTAIAPTFHQLADRIAKRGLVIVISDLYDDPAEILKALQHFVHKRHQVIVFHLLDEAELTFPFTKRASFVDRETNRRIQVDPNDVGETYRREMQSFLERYRSECGDRNIDYHTVTTSTPYDRMLLDYLARRRRVR
ncbi:MAG: DUF58 domain-containing protein, partial [Phycisphaerae bacterium]|nr:DUF58 domain-containing protein [Phycisphaerae bacterium]